jgi:hypothetical protein
MLLLTLDFSSVQLVIPKSHGAKLTDIDDESLAEMLVRHLPFLSGGLPCLGGLELKPEGFKNALLTR